MASVPIREEHENDALPATEDKLNFDDDTLRGKGQEIKRSSSI